MGWRPGWDERWALQETGLGWRLDLAMLEAALHWAGGWAGLRWPGLDWSVELVGGLSGLGWFGLSWA